jgi:asparagine synthase (glutamine-hydrolysing)
MCGIVGFTHKNPPVSSARIRELTSSLKHRGPDQQGTYESPDISLGAVRLKIIDLHSGDQPMFSEDRDTVLVFNGEIYNHAELREELEGLGHRFTSRSDTEVVLHAFLEWGTRCFARLRGMFGLALWTESQKRLVLARDRVGIKPLYFYRKNGDIYFSSELKGILLHPEVDRFMDLDGLNCYLCLNYVPSPHTLVQGIEKLAPGHMLIWHDGVAKTEAYWRYPTRAGSHQTQSLEAAKEELDSLLRLSVREHMISDVPLGVWASGGIDSSTILHYATQVATSKLKTFSITFKGRSFDESAYIREVAARYGTDHTEFDLSHELDMEGAIQEFAYYSDEPSADAGSLPVWFLAKLSARDVTVALSGEGADEVLGGYLTYLADRYARWARFVPAGMRRMALAALRYWPVSDEKISFEYKLKRFLKASLLPADEAHLFWNGTFFESEKADFFLPSKPEPIRRLLRNMPDVPGLSRYLLFDQRYYLPDDILYKVDRMSMAHSLEIRPPFLDHRIVEFTAALPENYKVRGSKLKYLLHALMKDKLPRSVLGKKKIGFDIPAHEWFRGVLKPLLLDTLTESAVKETGLFRWEGIRAVMANHMERRASLGYHLWGLLILFLWMKRWRIETAPVPQESRETLDSVLAPT